MPKFEYMIVEIESDFRITSTNGCVKVLNAHGENGWELVSVIVRSWLHDSPSRPWIEMFLKEAAESKWIAQKRT